MRDFQAPNDPKTQYLIEPNCSMSGYQALVLALFLAGVCLTIAVAMTLIHGAWPILPFAGLEAVLVGSAIYTVQKRTRQREWLVVHENHIHFKRTDGRAFEEYRFDRDAARYRLASGPGKLAPSRLKIGRVGERFVEIGAFLTDDERESLADSLSKWLPEASGYERIS